LLGEGSPSQLSDVISFLLSEEASWVTGQGIVVDGGYLIS
jgi:NAD(P)-dependent dehydrogenase (short-subunit alcohol dehydrogenase family)